MAVTITKVADGEWSLGNKIAVLVDLTAITYVAGGVPIAPGDVGLGKIMGATVTGVSTAAGVPPAAGLNWIWDTTNLKLIATFPTGGASTPGTLVAPAVGAPGGAALSGAPGGAALSGAPSKGTIACAVGGATTDLSISGDITAGTLAVSAPTIGTLAVSAPTAPALTAGVGKEPGAIALTNCTVRVMFIGY